MSAISLTSAIYTREEVAKHHSKSDAWIIISDKVYNISKFNHPGLDLTVRRAGKDVTQMFTTRHGLESVQLQRLQNFLIGRLAPIPNDV